MDRKQTCNVEAQIAALRASPGVVSLTVHGASIESVDYRTRKPKKSKTRPGIVADEELARRIEARDGTEGIFMLVPIKTKCQNAREHHFARNRRVKLEYVACEVLLNAHILKRDELANGCTIKFTRIGRKVDDDNLRGYCKHLRDSIAKFLFGGEYGQRDSDPRATWVYDQQYLGVNSFGVTISIQKRKE